LNIGVTLTNDLLNPEIARPGEKQQAPYVLKILPLEKNDSYGDIAKAKPIDWPARDVLKPLENMSADNTVYKTTWGTVVDLDKLET
jgi:hypothetical protein